MRDPDGRMLGMITGGQRYNAATDAQNSTLALAEDGTESTDPDVAYDYTPYGQTEATTAGSGDQAAQTNPFTYTGAYELDNGDKALGHRSPNAPTASPNRTPPGKKTTSTPTPNATPSTTWTPRGCVRAVCSR
ncbi:hypothetical protein [Haloactinospora alba]|uniref:hypothetical protein n=1 Tax=Haloactinospora alba TaxID=405555 RepID=UPI00114F0212|nr:hypothetical protein [Haloactinospora alba]